MWHRGRIEWGVGGVGVGWVGAGWVGVGGDVTLEEGDVVHGDEYVGVVRHVLEVACGNV